jgi:hypothetical protein
MVERGSLARMRVAVEHADRVPGRPEQRAVFYKEMGIVGLYQPANPLPTRMP